MSTTDGVHEPKRTKKRPLRLISRTLAKAWDGNIFSESAEAAFWQTLSLPPLLLGLLGSLGFLGEWFGPELVATLHDRIIGFCHRVFTPDVVVQIIEPTVNDILTKGKGEVVSIGFVISLWAGSSAMSSFVDAITVAHDQYGVRNEVWQRIFALLLYLAGLVLLVIGLPVIAIGPDVLAGFFPDAWQPTVSYWVSTLYYPVLAVLLMLSLATLYKLALPRRLPWHRGLPGAILAMVIFLLSSIGLRFYLGWITSTGYTYGALAAPIAWLLFTFFIGLAVVGGAYFNSAIQELWPAKPTKRQRRKWRRLEMERTRERLRAEAEAAAESVSGAGSNAEAGAQAGERTLSDRTTAPLRRPRGREPGADEEDGPREDRTPGTPETSPQKPEHADRKP